jgi:NTE family protein
MKRLLLSLFALILLQPLVAQPVPDTIATQGRPKVAVVLSGGGALGAIHVGALKVLEQAGMPVDMVVGTSIGSIVGGLYALVYRSEQLDSMFRSQQWTDMFAGSLMGDSIVRPLRQMTGDRGSVNFDDLPIPFRCVAVDINKMREVVLREGDLAQAMRASMAIPLVFKPVKMNGMRLVDGGVLNNLPVDVARDMGADFVIAVDLTVNKSSSSLRLDAKKYQQNCEDAYIYINPRLKGYGPEDFSPKKIAEMIAMGEKAGKASLKEMKKMKKRLAR